MGVVLERFIKGSHNTIKITLSEDGAAIDASLTQITISFGDVTITRTPTGSGVEFLSGVLTITPALLTEDLSSLESEQVHPVVIETQDSSNPNGVVWAGIDSGNELRFLIG